METSQQSSVPYSLSDIQLPESPGNLGSKSVKDQDKSKKALSSTKDVKHIPKDDKPNGVSPRKDSASEKSSSESESGEASSDSDSPEKDTEKKCKGDSKTRKTSNDESGRSKPDEKISSTSTHVKDKIKSDAKNIPKSSKVSDENKSNIGSDVIKFRKINIKSDKDSKIKSDGSKNKSDVSKHKSGDSKHKLEDSKLKSDDSKHNLGDKQKLDGADAKSHSKHRHSDNKHKIDEKHRSHHDKHKSDHKNKVSDIEQKPRNLPSCDTEISDDNRHKADSDLKADDRLDDSKSKCDTQDKEDKSDECERKPDNKQESDGGQQNQDEDKSINLKEKAGTRHASQKRESTEGKSVSKGSIEREQISKQSYSDSDDDQSSNSDTKHRRSDSKLKAKHERDSSSSSSSSRSSPERKHSRRLTSDSHSKNFAKKEQDFHIIDRRSLSKTNSVKKIEIDHLKVSSKTDTPRKKLKIKRDNVKVEKPILKERQDSPPRKSVEVSSLPVSKSETEKPVKVENTEPKIEAHEIPYVPRKVSIANRTLSRKSSEDKGTEPQVKKSKWGSIAAAQKSTQGISISTDSLKTLFPDFKLMNEPTTPMEIEVEDHSLPAEPELYSQTPQSEALEEGETSDRHTFTSKMDESEDVEQAKEAAEEDEFLESSDATKIIFIQNLVRPFTLNQLKELLKQSGKIVEEHFWIDKIKSKCFVMYETEREAAKARNALHNTRWPPSNPKILSVQFSNVEEMEQHKKGNEPPSRPIPEVKEPSEPREFSKTRDRLNEEPRRKDKERRERGRGQGMREWDRDKVAQESPEREHKEGKSKSSEKKDRKESKKRPSEDTSAKLLDDLFMKTKSTPCIYWLPLTDEQVKAKEEEKLRRKLEREKKIQQREQEEADRRSRRARSPRRSREKVNRKSSTRSRSPVSRRR